MITLQIITELAETNTPILVSMVIFSVLTAAGAVWYMFRTTKGMNIQDKLSSVLMFILIVLTTIYLVDKIISIPRDLLTEGENTAIFAVIKDFMLIITGYVFKSKQDEITKIN